MKIAKDEPPPPPPTLPLVNYNNCEFNKTQQRKNLKGGHLKAQVSQHVNLISVKLMLGTVAREFFWN